MIFGKYEVNIYMYEKHGRTFIKCDKENIDNFIKAIGNITKIGRKKKKSQKVEYKISFFEIYLYYYSYY